jgi:hypothetical protein
MVAYAYNPSYTGGCNQDPRLAQAKSETLSEK